MSNSASGCLRGSSRFLLGGLLLLALSCSAPFREYRCTVPTAGPTADVLEIWNCNRKIMVHAVKGKDFTLNEFKKAAAFFERLTAIPADTLTTPYGLLPGPELKQALSGWDDWLTDNADLLYWDDATRSVGVSGS